MTDFCTNCPFTRDSKQGDLKDRDLLDWITTHFTDCVPYVCPEKQSYCIGLAKIVKAQCNSFMYSSKEFHILVEAQEGDERVFGAAHEFLRYHLGKEGDLFSLSWKRRQNIGEDTPGQIALVF